MRVLFAALLIVLAAPLATAQNQTAPLLSPETNVLYAHGNNTSDSGDDEIVGWMNTLEDDGDDNARGPEGGPMAPHTESRTHRFLLDPGLRVDLQLSGDVEFVVHVGSTGQQGLAQVSVELVAGDQTVASGEAQPHAYTASEDDPYDPLTWTVPAAVSAIAAGTDVEWRITVQPASTGTFIGVDGDRGRSHVVLPVTQASGGPSMNETGNRTTPPEDGEAPVPTVVPVAAVLVAWQAARRMRP